MTLQERCGEDKSLASVMFLLFHKLLSEIMICAVNVQFAVHNYKVTDN